MTESDARIQDRISRMTLDEKVGATLTVLVNGTAPCPPVLELIRTCFCGGLRAVPGNRFAEQNPGIAPVPGAESVESLYAVSVNPRAAACGADHYRDTLAVYQEAALARRAGIPLHIAYDQEGDFSGDFKFGGIPLFPPPMGLAAAGGPDLAYDAALAIARVARGMGINMIHSPVLDVNTEPSNPEIYTRAYSDRAEKVAEYGLRAARGFRDGGLIATAKHFPGRGDSAVDAHTSVPVINAGRDTLWNRELLPYRELIAKDAIPAIMIAHSRYPALDEEHIATVSPRILQGLLREKLGFGGVITTDAVGMRGITAHYEIPDACVKALAAGADLVLLRQATSDPIVLRTPEILARIRRAVEEGELPLSDLDAKLGRILRMKEQAGLFDAPPDRAPDLPAILADPRIRDAERRAGRNVLILRRDEGALPLPAQARALVVEQSPGSGFLPQDATWHDGSFYEALSRHSQRLGYLEVAFVADDEQVRRALETAKRFDTVIVTNWYRRGLPANNRMAAELARLPGKTVICVANTPYRELSVPDEARNAVVAFGLSPESLRHAAAVLFGAEEPGASWPIDYRP